MIPRNITKEHIIKAIEEAEMGIPKYSHSDKNNLEYNGKHYPLKYIISLANKYANGEELKDYELDVDDSETNDFLKSLNFNIVNVSEE